MSLLLKKKDEKKDPKTATVAKPITTEISIDAISEVQTGSTIENQKGQDKPRQSKITKRSMAKKSLSAFVLKDAILNSTKSGGGLKVLQGVLRRNTVRGYSDDVAIPMIILEIIRDLISEGYEL